MERVGRRDGGDQVGSQKSGTSTVAAFPLVDDTHYKLFVRLQIAQEYARHTDLRQSLVHKDQLLPLDGEVWIASNGAGRQEEGLGALIQVSFL